LAQGATIYCRILLARRNNLKRLAYGWERELERDLVRGMINLLTQPLRRRFDRSEAYAEAEATVPDMLKALREHLEAEFAKGMGPVRRGLNEDDDRAYLERAREDAVVLGVARRPRR